LFFAAVGLFIQNPLIIQDLGFQLSFAAAWGIVVLTPRLIKGTLIERLPKVYGTTGDPTAVERPVIGSAESGLTCAHCGFHSAHSGGMYCPKCGMRLLHA